MERIVCTVLLAFSTFCCLAISELWRSRYEKLMDEFEDYKKEKE